MNIREIRQGKEAYLDLLLLADPSAEMIGRYLEHSFLFIGVINGTAACCAAVLPVDGHTAEIKNLAVIPQCRRQGLAGKMLRFIEKRLCHFDTLALSTGSSGKKEPPFWQEVFYRRLGFEPYKRIEGFFTDNYPDPLYEDDGRVCRDMIYLHKSLK